MTVFCPCCAGGFRPLKNGRLPRHGFKAFNVRYGESGGFHNGGCQGQLGHPIGTDPGNDRARETIKAGRARRDYLRGLASPTDQEAADHLRAQKRGRLVQSHARGLLPLARYQAQVAAIDALTFTAYEIGQGRSSLVYFRTAEANYHDALATRLEELLA